MERRRGRWRWVAVIAVLPTFALAQAPTGADTLSRRAIAESLKVFRRLDTLTQASPTDAALWFRRGMVGFALAERAAKYDDGAIGLDYSKLRVDASSALLAAVRLDSSNAEYAGALARFRATDRGFTGRRTAVCDARLENYHDQPDPAIRVTRMLDMATKCWLDYDGYANRAQSNLRENDLKQAAPTGIADAGGRRAYYADIRSAMERAVDSVKATLVALPFDVAGETDYLRATTLAREAYRVAPDSGRAYEFLMMLYVARDNWTELQKLARERTRRDHSDNWARMALALASYRLHPSKAAAASFDSVLAQFDAPERARLDRIERVLHPNARLVGADSTRRAASERAVWTLAQPLWSAPHADPRAEFLARVTYAELRWSVPSEGIRGADTHRGMIFIRYGPPVRRLGFQEDGPLMHEFWIYDETLMFAFDKAIHTGMAYFPGPDLLRVSQAMAWQPARWDNIAIARIDSMPTQTVRFRAAADSVQLSIAARAPVETFILAGVGGDASAHMWLYGLDAPGAFTDTVPVGSTGRLQWTQTLAAGAYYYRVESMIPATLFAGRTAGTITAGRDTTTGFALRGFGLSDVLLASRANTSVRARRWNDFTPELLLGNVKRGSELTLVWEVYEAAARNGNSTYDISVTIDREKSRLGRIAAQIVGSVAGAVGVTRSGDRLAMTFARTVPHATTIADAVTLSFGETPVGSYLLTLKVTDRVSGRAVQRTVRLTIDE